MSEKPDQGSVEPAEPTGADADTTGAGAADGPSPAQGEATAAAESDGAGEDIRAKMREALDRKHQREHEGEAHLQGHEKAHGVHGRSGGPRQFRRKTGP